MESNAEIQDQPASPANDMPAPQFVESAAAQANQQKRKSDCDVPGGKKAKEWEECRRYFVASKAPGKQCLCSGYFMPEILVLDF